MEATDWWVCAIATVAAIAHLCTGRLVPQRDS